MKAPSILLLLLSADSLLACDHSYRFRSLASHSNAHTLSPRAERPRPKLTAHEELILNSFSNVSISQWSYYYTHGVHVAGQNKTIAEWTRDKFRSYGLSARLDTYEVFLNYPISHSLSLSYGNGSTYNASLTEDSLVEDSTSSYTDRVPTFHGYSASGDVSAEYVYVGLGRKQDFKQLKALGVDLKGKIALVKYGDIFRGLKVRNAQNEGMIGAVLFTDPKGDGSVTVANGYEAYPAGPARNPSSVQRGSVQFLGTASGDPSTPGYPSLPGAERKNVSGSVPSIPSIPISAKEVEPLLAALDGSGLSSARLNISDWNGGLAVSQGSYWSGPAPGAKLALSNKMRETITPIWNVVGVINGTSPDVVLVGNHRDAWIVGGAADPNSGSAVLIELAKTLQKLRKTGWKPRRTIVLASWDGEEYGLLGSVEFYEHFEKWAKASIVANLNIDVAVEGSKWYTDATPEMGDFITQVIGKVPDPVKPGKTILDREGADEYGVLGSGSDYTAFVTNGISALDMGFTSGPSDPVYHYHSNYDSYHWMSTFGDPGFRYHVTAGQILGLMTYHLSSAPIIPFNTSAYGAALSTYFTTLQSHLKSSNVTLDLKPLSQAIDTFSQAAKKFDSYVKATDKKDERRVRKVNEKLKSFERPLAEQGGLPGRQFYKNSVHAPGEDTGYAPVTYPGITEAVNRGEINVAKEWVGRTARGIRQAAKVLDV